jgi:hypothetical protein
MLLAILGNVTVLGEFFAITRRVPHQQAGFPAATLAATLAIAAIAAAIATASVPRRSRPRRSRPRRSRPLAAALPFTTTFAGGCLSPLNLAAYHPIRSRLLGVTLAVCAGFYMTIGFVTVKFAFVTAFYHL